MYNYILKDNIFSDEFLKSFPVGNGRMGATVSFCTGCDSLCIDEESIWSYKSYEIPENLYSDIQTIKSLFMKGEVCNADKTAKRILRNSFHRISSYEYAGKINLLFHENDYCTNYTRQLDIMNGVANAQYKRKGKEYKRTVFSSYPDDVIVYNAVCNEGFDDVYISYDRENIISTDFSDNVLKVTAKTIFGDKKFAVGIYFDTDGTVKETNGEVCISCAKEITLYIRIFTEFRKSDEYNKCIFSLLNFNFDNVLERHKNDFHSYMSRADINIMDNIPLDVPISKRLDFFVQERFDDYHLISMLWQYGRYLLVSSSREGSLPSNLQGLWVSGIKAPWNSDYHTNINLQMNYWHSQVSNLSELAVPLFDYIRDYLLSSAKNVAEKVYHSRGAVVHHLSDIYGFCSVADGVWGLWPHGLSWLCFNLWEHYLYNPDTEFLRNTAYEIIKEASLFFIDSMYEDEKGRLMYAPSTSPENKYYVKDNNGNDYICFTATSTAMDISIISGLLRMYTKASDILGIEDKDVIFAKEALDKLPGLYVGKHGQLAEWIEDYDEVELGHRHFSNTFGLFPDNAITKDTPELFEAVSATFKRRLENETNGAGASTAGWSLAWLICSYARLKRGNDAYTMIRNFVSRCLSSNLMSLYPYTKDEKIFQIDANMGYVAGISEMLIQSHEGVISLIPAISDKWTKGEYRGLLARGGYEVDAKWDQSEVIMFKVKAKHKGVVTIQLPPSQKNMLFYDNSQKEYKFTDNKCTLYVDKEIVLKKEK